MKKVLSGLVAMLVLLSIAPFALANSVGSGVGVTMDTEDFPPAIWMCGDRIVLDDNGQPGRISPGGDNLVERINNYAFEGEQIVWTALVLDKNGIDKIRDVYVTVGPTQDPGNEIQANCRLDEIGPEVPPSCNARIGEEYVDPADFGGLGSDEWNNIAAMYECTFTVESPFAMQKGEYWVTVEVEDLDGQIVTFDENEYWFFNPEIALAIEGNINFGTVRPGTTAYSDTLKVGNDAEASSGVILDMFISGTDFYDSSSSGAKCPISNKLELKNFRYYAVNGAYSTKTDLQTDLVDGDRTKDDEGYVNIEDGTSFNNPAPFYDNAEILQAQKVGPYYTANVLAPGAEMSVTFKLDLPVPCNGDFDTGSIYFYGEAI